MAAGETTLSWQKNTKVEMPPKCRLTVAHQVVRSKEFMDIIYSAEKEVMFHLPSTVISAEACRRIFRAMNASEKLYYIREAFENCINPHMIDELIAAFSKVRDGQSRDSINAIYKRLLSEHYCEDCSRWKTLQESSASQQKGLLYQRHVQAHMADLLYTDEEKKNLVGYPIFLVVPLGKTGTGKTSLLRSIMEQSSQVTKPGEETRVAELSIWIPSSQPDWRFLMYDVGGHSSYKSTSHAFQVNSPHMLSMICHDISSNDYEETMTWLKDCQRNAPESTFVLVLTKMDCCKQESLDDFKKEFSALIEHEIDGLEQRKEECQTDDSYLKLYVKQIENYNSLKQQVKDKKLCVALCGVSEDSIDGCIGTVTEFVLNWAKDARKRTGMRLNLRPIDQDLFVKIGELGIKHPVSTLSMGMELKSNESTEKGTLINEMIYDNRNDHKVPSYSRVESAKKHKFMKFEEVLCIFDSIYKEHNPGILVTKDKVEQELKISLSNLRENGLLKYFAKELQKGDIIYNNLNTLVTILDCIFDHRLQTGMEFDRKAYFGKKLMFQLDTQLLTAAGTLTMALLGYLLRKNGCTISKEEVVKMVTSLDVAFAYSIENNTRLFVPFFLASDPPRNLDELKKDMSSCGQTALALHTMIDGNAPAVFFHFLVIKLYEEVSSRFPFKDAVWSWKNGVHVTFCHHKARLMMLRNDEQIDFFITADVQKEEAHVFLFQFLNFMERVVPQIRDAKLPGLYMEHILKCTHCRLDGSPNPHIFRVVYLLHSMTENKFSCGTKQNLPRALVAPLPKESTNSQRKECHNDLMRYLQNHFSTGASQVNPKIRRQQIA